MWWLLFVCRIPTDAFLFHSHLGLSRGAFRTRLLEIVSTRESSPPLVVPAAATLKEELIRMGINTARGFRATSGERQRVKELIEALEEINPTSTPASAFFTPTAPTTRTSTNYTWSAEEPSAAGKWSLIYTDAPDIISLQQTAPFAELGRIGQNCQLPFVENVIEWKRPSWLPSFGPSSVVQKVITEGRAINDSVVNLQLSGIRVEGNKSEAPWLPSLDVSRGFIKLPFGRFTILYLDDDLRITRTGQNYVAVNQRMDPSNEWF